MPGEVDSRATVRTNRRAPLLVAAAHARSTAARSVALVVTAASSWILAAASAFSLGGGASAASPPEIMVYAAASLREALQDLAEPCGREAGATLVYNFGASNDLARQIEAAGKADLFISADESLMDRLQTGDLLEPGSRRSLLGNRLVVIASSDRPITVSGAQDLARQAKRLSLANPEAVPAGRYARAWLEEAGAWEQLKGRVVPGVDVRAALAAVESGAVDLGVVYRTDAIISKKVAVVFEVSESEGPSIAYPVALVRGRPGLARSRKLLACLSGPAAKTVFEQRGFLFLDRAP